MLIEKQVLETIEKYNLIEGDEHIVIGLSGGPDSMCLFRVLEKLKANIEKYKRLEFTIVHIDHQLRGEVSREEANFVRKFCEEKGVSFILFEEDCERYSREKKISTEEAGRELRYRAFDEVAKKIERSGIKKENIKIAVAQNLDDRVETALFRIIRGAGLKGLASIPFERKGEAGYSIIRPLMECKKKDILIYNEEENLNPRIDLTNKEEIYSRNKIRLSLIPYIEKNYNPSFKEAINRLSDTAFEDNDYMELESKRYFEEALIDNSKEISFNHKNLKAIDNYKNLEVVDNLRDFNIFEKENQYALFLDIEKIRKLHIAIRKRIYLRALKEFDSLKNVSNKHFAEMDKMVFSEEASLELHLPQNIIVRKIYGQIGFSKGGVQRATKEKREKIKYSFDIDRLREFFSEDMINSLKDKDNKIQLRTRKAGDYILISGGKKKKLKKYYIDEKVPKYLRDDIELVCIENLVIEILLQEKMQGKNRKSKYIFANKSSKNILDVEI